MAPALLIRMSTSGKLPGQARDVGAVGEIAGVGADRDLGLPLDVLARRFEIGGAS